MDNSVSQGECEARRETGDNRMGTIESNVSEIKESMKLATKWIIGAAISMMGASASVIIYFVKLIFDINGI
jgi:hypothetical protein